MNCPNCGNEMQPGHLFGKAPLIWSSKPRKMLLIADKEEISILGGRPPVAHSCKECKTIVFQYE